MASRIGSIIAIADMKSAAFLEALPDGSKAKSNIAGINGICRALLQRRTPLLPTARLVSEEGRKNNPHFPLERTIFNSYGKVIRIWKKAYHDVMNIDADPPIAPDEVASIDTSLMAPSVGNLVDRLKAIVLEQRQRCNVLKEIIDQYVPDSSDPLPRGVDTDEIMTGLGNWLQALPNGGFQLDELSVKVSRKTPPGTRIMERRLFDELGTLTEDYERRKKSRKARAG